MSGEVVKYWFVHLTGGQNITSDNRAGGARAGNHSNWYRPAGLRTCLVGNHMERCPEGITNNNKERSIETNREVVDHRGCGLRAPRRLQRPSQGRIPQLLLGRADMKRGVRICLVGGAILAIYKVATAAVDVILRADQAYQEASGQEIGRKPVGW